MMSTAREKIAALTSRLKLLRNPGYTALNQAIELEEMPPPRSLKRLISIVCGFIGLGLLWAMVTHVPIVARADGQVMPAGDVIAIQHLEGGIVSEIAVEEGETVKASQTLVRLAPLDTESQFKQLTSRRASLVLSIERQRAIAEGRAPAFDKAIDGFVAQKSEQASFYTAQLETAKAQQNVLASQLAQRRSDLERLKNQIEGLERDVASAEAELEVREGLFKKGLTTRDRFYAAQRDTSELKNNLINTQDELSRVTSEITEAEQRLAEFDNQTRSDAREAVNKLVAELGEVDEALTNLKSRKDRLNIQSPVTGIVKGLTVQSVNSVVKPGETILEVVPTGDRMVVTANVKPQDIGRIRAGQRVDVRVAAFDFATYGSLTGKIERISASTFQDQRGNFFYKARIELDKAYFGRKPNRNRVLPGMTVEVDIRTGVRSIMSYMLKPVARSWQSAFHEN